MDEAKLHEFMGREGCSTPHRRLSARHSLSQEVGLGLGAQAGEARLRDVFAQAGFKH